MPMTLVHANTGTAASGKGITAILLVVVLVLSTIMSAKAFQEISEFCDGQPESYIHRLVECDPASLVIVTSVMYGLSYNVCQQKSVPPGPCLQMLDARLMSVCMGVQGRCILSVPSTVQCVGGAYSVNYINITYSCARESFWLGTCLQTGVQIQAKNVLVFVNTTNRNDCDCSVQAAGYGQMAVLSLLSADNSTLEHNYCLKLSTSDPGQDSNECVNGSIAEKMYDFLSLQYINQTDNDIRPLLLLNVSGLGQQLDIVCVNPTTYDSDCCTSASDTASIDASASASNVPPVTTSRMTTKGSSTAASRAGTTKSTTSSQQVPNVTLPGVGATTEAYSVNVPLAAGLAGGLAGALIAIGVLAAVVTRLRRKRNPYQNDGGISRQVSRKQSSMAIANGDYNSPEDPTLVYEYIEPRRPPDGANLSQNDAYNGYIDALPAGSASASQPPNAESQYAHIAAGNESATYSELMPDCAYETLKLEPSTPL